MPVDGTVPPQLATGFIRLPGAYDVVGVAGSQLVLAGGDVPPSRDEQGNASGGQLITWDPATGTTDWVAGASTLIAAAEGQIAWIRTSCTECGVYVKDDGVLRVYPGVPSIDPTIPGALSPDGRFLAVAITGSWPGGGAGAVVHSVAVVDLRPTRRIAGRPQAGPPIVATPDIRSTAPVGMTWSSGGALLVRDTSDRVVAYEPRAGGTARMFAFRPREAPRTPTALAPRPNRIPHTMPPLHSPPTTVAAP
jgi:hypothetical protein